MFDVSWSNRPSILSTASHDGTISIYSLQDSSGGYTQNESEKEGFSGQLNQQQKFVQKHSVFKTAPKWLKVL